MIRFNRKFLIALILFPIIFFLLRGLGIPNLENSLNKRRCDKESEIRKVYLDGIITRIYIDTDNHNHRVIYVRDKFGKEEKSLLFNIEGSGLFELLMEGDSILKPINSLTIIAKRDSLVIFDGELDYNCQE